MVTKGLKTSVDIWKEKSTHASYMLKAPSTIYGVVSIREGTETKPKQTVLCSSPAYQLQSMHLTHANMEKQMTDDATVGLHVNNETSHSREKPSKTLEEIRMSDLRLVESCIGEDMGSSGDVLHF